MKNIIYFLIGIVCFVILPVSIAMPQNLITRNVRLSSSPNPLGSGARALGMGNAFIAVADDATAASWNPGGLMQLETPEVSMVLYDAIRTEDYTFLLNPEADGSERTNEFNLNYFSAAYPFAIFEKNMIVSLNYMRLYDIDKELKFNKNLRASQIDIATITHYKAEGGIKALSPAYAVQVTENLSIGFALNFWLDALGGRNGWKEQTRIQGKGRLGVESINTTFGSSKEFDNARGFNYNLGVLWNINEMITLGAVFKSPLKLKMSHKFISQSLLETPDFNISILSGNSIEDTMKLNLPLSYGAGLSFRLSDALTVAFDAYRTEWGNYYFRSEDGKRTSPIDGRPRNESHINATTQVHVGAEYLFILEKTVIPVRGGVFYDPEPAEEFSEDFYGFSLGTGVSIGDVVIDAAYQYRWGRDSENRGVSISNTENRGISNYEADIDHHSFYLSATYHF